MPSYAVSRMRMWWKRNASSLGRVLIAQDQLLVRELHQMRAELGAHVLGCEVVHGVVDEQLADDGGRLDDRALLGAEGVEAGSEECVDRRRDRDVADRRGCAPGAVLEDDGAVVDEHGEQLLDEQGIAFGSCDDPVADVLVELGHAQEVPGDGRCIGLRQALEQNPDGAALRGEVRVALDELVPRRADHDELAVRRVLDDLLDELEEGRLGPVDVVEEREHRLLPSEAFEQAPRPPDQLLDRERRRREPDRRRDALGDLWVARERSQLLECRLGGVAFRDLRRVAHRLGERPEGDAVSVREAAAAQDPEALTQPRDELVEEA